MKKHLFTAIAMLLLLASSATAFLWVRSYWVADEISRRVAIGLDTAEQVEEQQASLRGGEHRTLSPLYLDVVESAGGSITLSRSSTGCPAVVYTEGLNDWQWYSGPAQARSEGMRWWFRLDREADFISVYVPYWPPLVLSLILPTVWAWRMRRATHRQRCGFEVRVRDEPRSALRAP